MSSKLAQKLRISLQSCENVKISAFGGEPSSFKQLGVTAVNIETLSGEQVTLSVLFVAMITAPLQNTYHTHVLSMKHFNGLQFANPVTKGQQIRDILINWCRLLLVICW